MGKLYLLPVPIFMPNEGCASQLSSWQDSLSLSAVEYFSTINDFIVENAKTARQIFRLLDAQRDLRQINIIELNKHLPLVQDVQLNKQIEQLLISDLVIGLISEAGCPAVADPGADVVKLAQQLNVPVIPLSGPSSILLALMASGLGGQNFHFHGYLAKDSVQRIAQIKQLEKDSQSGVTQIFIETPYRNQALLEDLLNNCAGKTMLCLALAINSSNEQIKTNSIKKWRSNKPEHLANIPCVFVLKSG